jgi:hypothetical protein
VRKTSRDGTSWSEREILVNLATKEGNTLGNMVVSPAVLYNNGVYRMWFVDSESRIARNVAYSESINGHDWTEKKICNLNGKENIPWHIDVNIIDGKYHLLSYNFNTSEERQNFYNYCKSKVFRFILSYLKVNAHNNTGELSNTPWLDFTKEWDDAKLCKEFGISEELWNYIDNFIPDYYNDYKSGF